MGKRISFPMENCDVSLMLYQRKQGRDLFDLYHALTNLDLDTKTLIKCYKYVDIAYFKMGPLRIALLNHPDLIKES